MHQLPFIHEIDGLQDHERLDRICTWLENRNVPFRLHEYATGTNAIVDLGNRQQRIGLGSHYDRVPASAGANDNGSAVAVCMDIIERFLAAPDERLGIRVFFFDEEETGLRGSQAYVREFGVQNLQAVINMELVGIGDQLALWPVKDSDEGLLLAAFESVAASLGHPTARFDKIVTNTADHVSFRQSGMKDCFTITCITDQEIALATQYFAALARGADHEELWGILSQATIFQHYHRPTDTADRLHASALTMAADTIWQTILRLQA